MSSIFLKDAKKPTLGQRNNNSNSQIVKIGITVVINMQKIDK